MNDEKDTTMEWDWKRNEQFGNLLINISIDN